MKSKAKGTVPVEYNLAGVCFTDFGTFPNPIRTLLVFSFRTPNPVKVFNKFEIISKVDYWGNHRGATT